MGSALYAKHFGQLLVNSVANS